MDAGLRSAVRARMRARVPAETIDARTTYGHVVVDEAQDLSPMAWRMLARRCPSGSMTLMGDLDQATSPAAPVR